MRKTTTALKQVPSKIILSTLFAILQNKVPYEKFQKSKLTYLISALCLYDFQFFDIIKYLILQDFKQSVLWYLLSCCVALSNVFYVCQIFTQCSDCDYIFPSILKQENFLQNFALNCNQIVGRIKLHKLKFVTSGMNGV